MIVKPDKKTPGPGTAIVKATQKAEVEVEKRAETLPAPLTPVMNMKELAEYQVGQLIPRAGTVELAARQQEILYAKVKDEDVEIRPDGLIYLPWVEYVSRLHEAFGMEWAIIPRGMPEMNPGGTGLLWGFFLMVKGRPAGFAIGEQEYYPNNATMTWGDACEGAKSNALMRLCKGIGISLELWKPSFVKRWKGLYAETYPDPTGKLNQWNKVRTLWRKKGPAKAEKKPEEPKKNKSAAGRSPSENDDAPRVQEGPAADDIADMAETQAPELDEAGKKKHLSNVQAIKLIVEKDEIEYRDFKKFLAEAQARSKSGRVFVRNKFNHPSLEAGNADDVAQLLNNLGPMMKKYIETRMKEEKDAKAKKKG